MDPKSRCYCVNSLKVGPFPSAFHVIRVLLPRHLLQNIHRIATKGWTLLAATQGPETGANYMHFRGPDPRLCAVL